MDVSPTTFERVRQLSRLALSEVEAKRFRTELAAILEAVEKLRAVPTVSVDQPSSRPLTEARADVPTDRGEAKAVVASAPRTDGSHVVVKGGVWSRA